MKTIRERQRNRDLGARIRAVRQSRNMSQSLLARRLGKSLRTVQKFEAGQVGISVNLLERIAQVLQVEAQELLGYGKDDTLACAEVDKG